MMRKLTLSRINVDEHPVLENGFRRIVFPESMNGKIEKLILALGEGPHDLFEMRVLTDIGEQIAFHKVESAARTIILYPRTPVHNTNGSTISTGPNLTETGLIAHNGKVFVEISGLQKGESIDYIELLYS